MSKIAIYDIDDAVCQALGWCALAHASRVRSLTCQLVAGEDVVEAGMRGGLVFADR